MSFRESASPGAHAVLRTAVDLAHWASPGQSALLNSSSLFFALAEVGAGAKREPPADYDLGEDLKACVFFIDELERTAKNATRPYSAQRDDYLGPEAPFKAAISGQPLGKDADLQAPTPNAVRILDEAESIAERTTAGGTFGARHILAALITHRGQDENEARAVGRLREAGLAPDRLARRLRGEINSLAPFDRDAVWKKLLPPATQRADVFALAFFLVLDGRLPLTTLEHPDASKIVRACLATMTEVLGPETSEQNHLALSRLENHFRKRGDTKPDPLWLSWITATETRVVEDFERLLEL